MNLHLSGREENQINMAKKKVKAQASIVRSLVLSKITRMKKDHYSSAEAALDALTGWIKGQSARTNKKAGGLGRK